jgi:hypothetical protein
MRAREPGFAAAGRPVPPAGVERSASGNETEKSFVSVSVAIDEIMPANGDGSLQTHMH